MTYLIFFLLLNYVYSARITPNGIVMDEGGKVRIGDEIIRFNNDKFHFGDISGDTNYTFEFKKINQSPTFGIVSGTNEDYIPTLVFDHRPEDTRYLTSFTQMGRIEFRSFTQDNIPKLGAVIAAGAGSNGWSGPGSLATEIDFYTTKANDATETLEKRFSINQEGIVEFPGEPHFMEGLRIEKNTDKSMIYISTEGPTFHNFEIGKHADFPKALFISPHDNYGFQGISMNRRGRLTVGQNGSPPGLYSDLDTDTTTFKIIEQVTSLTALEVELALTSNPDEDIPMSKFIYSTYDNIGSLASNRQVKFMSFEDSDTILGEIKAHSETGVMFVAGDSSFTRTEYRQDRIESSLNNLIINSQSEIEIGESSSDNKILNVHGGVKYDTVSTKPDCDLSTRGTTWFTKQESSGISDLYEICMKNSEDEYEWSSIVQSSTNVFTEFFESEELTIINAGGYSVTHSLSKKPSLIKVYAVCKTAQNGYSIGDITEIPKIYQGNFDWYFGTNIVIPNDTNIDLYVSNNGFRLMAIDTSNIWGLINNNDWRIIIRAWA